MFFSWSPAKNKAATTRRGEHSIVIEKVRYRKTWLPRQNSLCTHCINGVVDDEFLFLTEYNKYNNIRETYFSRTEDICSGFTKKEKKNDYSSFVKR